MNISAGSGVAVREVQLQAGSTGYLVYAYGTANEPRSDDALVVVYRRCLHWATDKEMKNNKISKSVS